MQWFSQGSSQVSPCPEPFPPVLVGWGHLRRYSSSKQAVCLSCTSFLAGVRSPPLALVCLQPEPRSDAVSKSLPFQGLFIRETSS